MLTLNAFILALLMNSSPSSQGSKDNELKPYINTFIEVSAQMSRADVVFKTMALKIKFGDPGEKNIAACYYLLNEVVVDKNQFIKLTDENREELIFHELGHCALDLMHSENGIMKAIGFHNPKFYTINYTKLINDLFGRKPSKYIKVEYNPNKYPQRKTMSKKEEILKNDHAVVRFTAEWCPPCKAMKPIFEQVALENPTVKVYVIDIDKDNQTAVDFGVKGIPTLMKIVDKAEEKRTVGGQTKDSIQELFRRE